MSPRSGDTGRDALVLSGLNLLDLSTMSNREKIMNRFIHVHITKDWYMHLFAPTHL